MTVTFRVDFGLLAGIILGLIYFGIGFNFLFSWLLKKGYTEGFLSLIVAAGVFLTILPLALISWQFVFMVYLALAGSGLPMIIGSIFRYMRAREKAQNILVQLASENGNQKSGMAE